jgi:radical SAM protein with 4Fe4S-binding SPASM domain
MMTHILLTRACNATCRHCFVPIEAKPDPDELSTEEWHAVFEELDQIGCPDVTVGGGEPLLRRDFDALLDGMDRFQLDPRLCTNGTLVTEAIAERIAASRIGFVSVSLDGPDAATHDAVRGAGHFQRASRGIRRLVAAGLRVETRATVTTQNASRLIGFFDAARELGVARMTVKPFRRSGAASAAVDLELSRSAYEEAVSPLRELWREAGSCDLNVSDGITFRPPEWLGISPPFSCVGGTTSVSIKWNGAVTGCSSLDIARPWDVREHGVLKAWREAPSVAGWRRFEGNATCSDCETYAECAGGCRTRAAGRSGNINAPDSWVRE